MSIKIVTEEFVTKKGKKMRKLVDIKACSKDELPEYYVNTVPSFWVEQRSDGKTTVHVNSLAEVELVVGESYPANYFNHFLSVVKASGYRLARLRARTREYKI